MDILVLKIVALRCIVRLFMVLHGSVCWMVSCCYNGLLTVIVSRIVQGYYTGTLNGLFTCRITQDRGVRDLSDRILQFLNLGLGHGGGGDGTGKVRIKR